MSKAIAIVIFVIVGIAGVRFWTYYKSVDEQVERQNNRWDETVATPPVSEPGMPASLEPLLEKARGKGARDLKQWLDQYRRFVREPRLSEIELDYVVMVGRSDPPEARRVFSEVRQRNGANSPIADRIEKLSKTYE